jgi:putative serine protease PepD
MSMDDDADDDAAGIGPPLPPDDRLWRHPSELTSWGAGGAPTPSSLAAPPSPRGALWPVAAAACLLGAALCGGALAVSGALSRGPAESVVEKVAMTPVVSTPLIGSHEDDGVAALAERLAPAVVHLVVTSDRGTTPASGVIVRDDGIVYTSAHEVADATSIAVVLADGRRFEGDLVGADLPTDVAVLNIEADGLTVAVLGSSTDLPVGSSAMALGWPTDGAEQPSVTTGVVSAVEHRLDAQGESLHGLIQTDAPIEPAWSGGPLVDASGAVIGITTDLAGGEAGFGFATPIDLVRRVAQELIDSGTVARGWLGIEGTDLSMAEAARMGVPGGAAVEAVLGGSPAAVAGLEVDDVITELGGHRVASSSGLVVAMRHHKPGEEVDITYWRDGRRHELTLTLTQQP